MKRPAKKIEPVATVDAEPETDEVEEPVTDSAKRKQYLRRLEKVMDGLFKRAEGAGMEGIKDREILYNLDVAMGTYIKLSDRDVPTPKDAAGASVTVQGLTREEAIRLISGHKEPPAPKDTPPASQ